ncbi:Zinc finger protein with KRAB and SCAN domains 3 [Ceratocystis lukuohia]
MQSPIRPEVMGITNLVSSRAMAQHHIPVSTADYQMSTLGRLPDPIDRSDSPHGSVHSMHSLHSRYSPRPGEMTMGYGSPGSMHHMGPADPSMGGLPIPGMTHSMPPQYNTDYKNDGLGSWAHSVPQGHHMGLGVHMQQPPHQQHQAQPQHPQAQAQVQAQQQQAAQQQQQAQQPVQTGPIKAHPCRTCGKGFARRSDLARHERIHSGHRPHACDYPGCGKQFIQRSALTVHTRVHTGEKPHMCERCGKPFGDSSSLARHRRTHSGRRPYKCPYANCQKTFTRRTTLTRHQNHHVGTIEEAAAATAAALASRPNLMKMGRSSDIDPMSQTGSPVSTPSPNQRPMSMSPAMSHMENRAPSAVDFQQYSTMPPHMRSDLSQQPSVYAPLRPTSHPTSYGPPPSTLEPSLDQSQGGNQQGQQQQTQSTPGSTVNSPHMSSVGSWQSPQHVSVGSSPHSSHHAHNNVGFVYPEPDTYTNQLYFNASAAAMRRSQGTEAGLVPLS